MTPYVNSIIQRSQPRNALLLGVTLPESAAPPAQAPSALPPAVQANFIRSAIGHAAVLSDTPEKWAATIALLKQHGIDPAGYEDFDKGRTLAIAASGVRPLLNDSAETATDGDREFV